MEWAVYTASSDSEDAETTEIDEEDETPSNTGQHGSLCGVAEESSTKATQGSINLEMFKKSASTGSDWDSMDSVKAETRVKTPYEAIEDSIHLEKSDGNKLSVPQYLRSTFSVNISEEEGISYSEPEVLTMQMSEEEQALCAQEDLGESSEELEFDSSTAKFGVNRKRNPKTYGVQRKKRHLAEDGTGNAYKLAKIEQPQKNQMPGASAECEESSDPTPSEWCETDQASHLEENYAAEEPINSAESTETLSHSSDLVEIQEGTLQYPGYKITYKKSSFLTADGMSRHQEVHAREWTYHCPECNLQFKKPKLLKQHHIQQHIESPHKCPDCDKFFVTAEGMREHQHMVHRGEVTNLYPEGNRTSENSKLLKHHGIQHQTARPYKCPDCEKGFVTRQRMLHHQHLTPPHRGKGMGIHSKGVAIGGGKGQH